MYILLQFNIRSSFFDKKRFKKLSSTLVHMHFALVTFHCVRTPNEISEFICFLDATFCQKMNVDYQFVVICTYCKI